MIGISQFVVKKIDCLSPFLAWCGRYSVIILAIHCVEHRFFDWNTYVFDRIPIEMHWLEIFVIHAAAIVGCAWIVVKWKYAVSGYLRNTLGITNKINGENYEKD